MSKKDKEKKGNEKTEEKETKWGLGLAVTSFLMILGFLFYYFWPLIAGAFGY